MKAIFAKQQVSRISPAKRESLIKSKPSSRTSHEHMSKLTHYVGLKTLWRENFAVNHNSNCFFPYNLRALFCVCYINDLHELFCICYVNDLRALFCINFVVTCAFCFVVVTLVTCALCFVVFTLITCALYFVSVTLMTCAFCFVFFTLMTCTLFIVAEHHGQENW